MIDLLLIFLLAGSTAAFSLAALVSKSSLFTGNIYKAFTKLFYIYLVLF